ncbi:MAG TPA: VOC family protein [Acidimicrobiia bacterium]|nr:VOC family protein [Acidimicrobiia bacterium]
MTTRTPTTTQQKTVWPSLVYEDARAAIRFLVDVFGFEERITVPSDGDDTVIVHAQLRWPEGGGVMLSTAHREGNVFSDRPVGTGSVYVVTDDPDAVYARATAAGLPVVQAIRDEDYGGRGFGVRDREGNIWSFGSYRGE